MPPNKSGLLMAMFWVSRDHVTCIKWKTPSVISEGKRGAPAPSNETPNKLMFEGDRQIPLHLDGLCGAHVLHRCTDGIRRGIDINTTEQVQVLFITPFSMSKALRSMEQLPRAAKC